MKGNIAIIAALSRELKPFVQDQGASKWKRLSTVKGVDAWEYRHRDGCWLAISAGMGMNRATVAYAEAKRLMSVDAVCSVGLVGAIDREILAEALFCPSRVIDTQTGERYRPAVWDEGGPILATTVRVADSVEKERLAASYGAGLVDMEAAAVARLALGDGIPFYCFKAVSDEAGTVLPDINPYIDAAGQMRMVSFIGYVLVRPWLWGGLIRLGRHSEAAAKKIAASLYGWLDDGGSIRREK